MDVSSKTDVGRRRKHNEDSLIVDDRRKIFVLADGMGGHKAGEMASKMAVEVAYDWLVASAEQFTEKKYILESLKSAALKAHEIIKISEKIDFNFKGMGTTLVIMVIKDNCAHICHVGDSRAYLIRKHIQQITQDQTLGNYLLEKKKKRFEDIPARAWHTITQAVGVSEKIVPALNTVDLKIGDVLLMCSDGLTDMVSDKELEEIIKKNKKHNFDKIADILVETANNKGGKDNITIIVVKYEDTENTLFWNTPLRVFKSKAKN